VEKLTLLSSRAPPDHKAVCLQAYPPHLGTAQFTPELSEHLFWWLADYQFCRYQESLRILLDLPEQRKGKQRPRQYRKTTPAIAAGITNKRWSIMELISYPLPSDWLMVGEKEGG
jgi:hypothetical protein